MNEIIQAETVRTGPEWARIIRDDLNRAVEGLVSAGQHLTEAKADVSHGEWLPMLNGIGISKQVAARLMKVSRNEAIGKVPNSVHFPRSLDALYELSRMDPSDIEDGTETGEITPAMTIKDAKNLAGKPGTSAFEKAMKNLKALRKNADRLSFTERDEVITAAERVMETKRIEASTRGAG